MKGPVTVFRDIAELVTVSGHQGPAAGPRQAEIGLIRDAYLAVGADGRVLEAGPMADLPRFDGPVETIDCSGCTVTPGFVDPHTHAVFGGWRADEFVLRLGGARYEEILAAGGGILDTMRTTRAASEDELYARSRRFLDEMLAAGTTTVEIKSGYGLDVETELRRLRVARRLDAGHPVDVVATFLGAHAVPPEFAGRAGDYVEFVIAQVLPRVAQEGLARFCDVFCERGVFDVDQSRRLLQEARRHGLLPRLHADEIEPLGGAALAAEVGAVSADHLLQAGDAGLEAMARAGVIAVLLPGTAFCLRKPYARAREMIDRFHLPVALASDFNPGSCPIQDMRLVMSLACLHMGMSPAEALLAATWNAACVLGVADRCGSLERGKDADLVVWDAPSHTHLVYRIGTPLARRVYKRGRHVAGHGAGHVAGR